MKRVLVVYFSQSGQLTRAVKQLVAPLTAANDIHLHEELLRPQAPYPFPWPVHRFIAAMPESVLLVPPVLEPLALQGDEQFDLVILAYQVWYLAPSGPMVAFLASSAGKRLLNGRPVVTVIACRNMWLTAQETMKRLVREAGGQLRDNVALTDQGHALETFITTPRWLLTGRRDAFWGFSPAGVSDRDIESADRFGRALRDALRADRERCDAPMLSGLGAARVDPRLIFSERAGQRAFFVWSRLIRLGGPPESVRRWPLLALFSIYLVTMILVVVPPSLFLQWLLRPLLARRLSVLQAYYESPSGR